MRRSESNAFARNSNLRYKVYILKVLLIAMERHKVAIEMTVKHIELLDSLKQEYGVQSRSRALEMLLDDLLKQDSAAPAE